MENQDGTLEQKQGEINMETTPEKCPSLCAEARERAGTRGGVCGGGGTLCMCHLGRRILT